jgi:TPR repeat protein
VQTLIRTRQQIRERVQANEYAELNRLFEALQMQWRQAPPGDCPAYLEAVQGYMLDCDSQCGKALTHTLKNWIDACPKAYHPHVVMGFHCFSLACQIRGQVGRHDVSDERWLAAEQACEKGAAHFLRAMERSAQPVAAVIGMLHISAYLREPGWLVELFAGQVARYRPSAHADVEVQEAAAPLLVRCGLTPLLELPQALPAGLSARLHEQGEPARDYWLRHALSWFPGCFEAVEAYATYLTPRWGGSDEAIDALASGPLCQGWPEAQRNAIRWLALEDTFWLPHARQLQQVATWHRTFDQWAQRELRPKERATLLARRGALRRYSTRDYAGAMRDFVDSVELYPDHGFVPAIGEPFHSLVCLVLFNEAKDDTQVLRTVIGRLCDDRRQAAACALRAVGHQFGLWGFGQSAEQARTWLRLAVKRQCGREEQGFDVLDVPRLLWAANLHEAAHFLYEACAELKLPDAAIALYDLHRGWLDNTPEHYLSGKAAEHWLLRAAESGHPLAKFELARQRMNLAQGLEDRKAVLVVKRLLLDALSHPQVHAKAQLQLGILLRQYGDARERVEAVNYLLGLAEYPDTWIAARACAELGLAWMQGCGTRKQSRYAAIEWANRAVALQSSDPLIEEIQAEIRNSHSRVKTLFTVCGAALFRGDLHASELPPKATGQQRASA